MQGYLLDTCVVSRWFDPNREKSGPIKRRINALSKETPLVISSITWGEIEYGHKVESDTETPVQTKFRQFVEEQLPYVLCIDRSTAIYYGQLRAHLFEKYSKANRRAKAMRAEELIDPATSRELGIQENDIWIAAHAMEHNLVLATCDKPLERVASQSGLSITVELWS